MIDAAPARAGDDPLAIICGGGGIPFAVADAVRRQGRPVVLFPLVGWADRQGVEKYPHHWINIGQLGRFRRLAREEGCRDLVLIGTLLRPSLSQVRLDWDTIRAFPQIWRAFRGGDDRLLSGIGRIFEESGFRLVGAHEVAPEILMVDGTIGRRQPTARDQTDIAQALRLLTAIGPFDVGQAVVVANGRVLAIEATEGTDHMLRRIADLRRDGRIRMPPGVGVLVKAPKPGQDRRIDLPAIGPPTIELVAQAQLAGVAVVAGSALIAEPDEVARLADAAGLFVVGIRDTGPRP
jgi:hypothetical protein